MSRAFFLNREDPKDHKEVCFVVFEVFAVQGFGV